MKYTRILLTLMAGLVLSTSAWAQTQDKGTMHKHQATQKEQTMMDQCKSMMESRQKMNAEMKAMDAELDQLVAEMNAAPADRKPEVTAAVVTKMAEQRRVRREKTEAMQMNMMQHMMSHMQMGKDSMGKCPMMKERMEKKNDTMNPNNE